MLEQLYFTTAVFDRATARKEPEYQRALADWAEHQSTELDREDGAFRREDIWGQLSFNAGLRLGLSLAFELYPHEEE